MYSHIRKQKANLKIIQKISSEGKGVFRRRFYPLWRGGPGPLLPASPPPAPQGSPAGTALAGGRADPLTDAPLLLELPDRLRSNNPQALNTGPAAAGCFPSWHPKTRNLEYLELKNGRWSGTCTTVAPPILHT